MLVKDIDSGEVTEWTLDAVLTEINRDRTDDWLAYDSTDWLEGWDEWVEGQYYTRYVE